ncbi:hypothetical protein AK830_g4832 [Neonectria ditissima]|uniref:AMP-dependent synthetase/ligase domain-containing protein n=1 Tax=Neonectria ditissima TaxID=78410 RepID=A0A0P7BFF1_9HYPO|nr:hypothetical protein AK830_g4832 [Neonectria ditissima]
MVLESNYSLADVLAVAKIHPFYVPNVQYPPDSCTVRSIREQVAKDPVDADLQTQPLLRKKDLYVTIERLINDTSPENSYRHSIYASVTGGGFGSKPMFFATDVHENRRHRANFGRFIRNMGLIKHGDWVLTVHSAGELYRSLDLTLEILENAGACVLSAGNNMSLAHVVGLLADYNVNVLSGDSSQVVQIAHYISTLPREEQEKLEIDKIIYTSETLTAAQRSHITGVLGPVKICSLMGSAEAGPYAVSNPDITGKSAVPGHEDFVFDTRATLFEILPPSFSEQGSNPDPMPEGEQGIIVQTSLSRLRNPLVRYITGDIGSLHHLSDEARSQVPSSYWPYLRILRLRGRDRRFSFEWDGEYFEFQSLASLLNKPECGLLQWQVLLDKMEPSQEASLEVRLLCSPRNADLLSEDALGKQIQGFLHVCSENEHRFRLRFVKDLEGFELSKTGRKVIKFVDRFT